MYKKQDAVGGERNSLNRGGVDGYEVNESVLKYDWSALTPVDAVCKLFSTVLVDMYEKWAESESPEEEGFTLAYLNRIREKNGLFKLYVRIPDDELFDTTPKNEDLMVERLNMCFMKTVIEVSYSGLGRSRETGWLVHPSGFHVPPFGKRFESGCLYELSFGETYLPDIEYLKKMKGFVEKDTSPQKKVCNIHDFCRLSEDIFEFLFYSDGDSTSLSGGVITSLAGYSNPLYRVEIRIIYFSGEETPADMVYTVCGEDLNEKLFPPETVVTLTDKILCYLFPKESFNYIVTVFSLEGEELYTQHSVLHRMDHLFKNNF
jgi:hypothetical protein